MTDCNSRTCSLRPMIEATAFWGILGWPFCRYVDRASSTHISHKHGPLRWTVNHACKTVPLHVHCNKTGYSRFPCGKEEMLAHSLALTMRKQHSVSATRAGRRNCLRIPCGKINLQHCRCKPPYMDM